MLLCSMSKVSLCMAKRIKFERLYESTGDDEIDRELWDLSLRILRAINEDRASHEGRTIVYLGIVNSIPNLNIFSRVAENCIDPSYSNYFFYDPREKILYWAVMR